MIDRTEFDLRLAAHHATTARCNARGWRAALAARDDRGVVRPAPRPGLARR